MLSDRAPEPDGDTVPEAAAPDGLSYGGYLPLPTVSAQHPVRRPVHHASAVHHRPPDSDLVESRPHERRVVQDRWRQTNAPALKGLAAFKHIQRTLTDQCAVLGTLTRPRSTRSFPRSLGSSSDSNPTNRAVEFPAGHKTPS